MPCSDHKPTESDTSLPYYRRDQAKGVTPPELTKDCTFAEHIVRARGKRTRFTSVSLDEAKISDFGPALYEALRTKIEQDGHEIIEHSMLMRALRDMAVNGEKADRLRAVLAQRYAKRRLEGLVSWTFNIDHVDRKELYIWSRDRVAPYFAVKRHG